MAQDRTTWYLIIRKGPKVGSAYPLPTGGSVSVGRQADNQILIDDPMVSRHHARLVWRGNTIVLEDLGSANGTWVNNVRITSPVALRAGDLIGLSHEVTLAFGDQPQADETVYESSAHVTPGAVAVAPVAVPASSPPVTPSARGGQGWVAFGLGGMVAILVIAALIAVGLAGYLLLRPSSEPEVLDSQALLPTSTPTPVPTATPDPTYTPVPADTPEPTATPYPTYTPVPTQAPTATPYPTYTLFPTQAPTATPYPTYTPYPTATSRPFPTQGPTDTPVPIATELPPYSVTVGRNVVYEPWGRPLDPDGCNGPYDDESPMRRFTIQIILTNNSNQFIPDHWSPYFVSASGRSLPTCIWYYNNTAVQPGEVIDVTFATHVETDDWVSALVFDELGYALSTCLNPSGQPVPCQ
jgi:hypothetical protein